MFCELPKFSNVFCTEMMSEENFIVCLDLSIISTFSGLTSDKISTECEAIITCLNLFFTIFTKLSVSLDAYKHQVHLVSQSLTLQICK